MRILIVCLLITITSIGIAIARDIATTRTVVSGSRQTAAWALLTQVNGPSSGYLLQENGGRILLDPVTDSRQPASTRSAAQ